MVRLRVKRGFFDREADHYRPSGEVFEVPEARAQVILAAGVAEVMEITAAPEPAKRESREPPKRQRKG